ncbi:hypothetical protein KM043_013123 [Ampulex compressa]|uniref:Venom protein n=1 Tax=Ampulex compressa TaxID=860918 RepID=A0A1W6EVU0_AMPCP|nr:venom protein [Ampulex compressa]KAG7198966.1 hypothetical protein KM043_013123 [Ampulex compressa]
MVNDMHSVQSTIMKFVGILVFMVLTVFFDHVGCETTSTGLGSVNYLGRWKALQSPTQITFKECLANRLNIAQEECSIHLHT